MKRLALAAAVAVSALVAGISAQAMPAIGPVQADDGITQVAQGCGPGGHRNGYGRCVPNYRPAYRRACPPGMHLNGYGRCRPNF